MTEGDCRNNNFLFYVEAINNSILQDYVVCYEAVRVGDKLKEPFVKTFWKHIETGEISHMSRLHSELFFGACVTKDGLRYKMKIKSFPERVITIHLKKSGSVVAKSRVDGKESRIKYIKVFTEKSFLGIPKVVSCTLFGVHKKKDVKENIIFTESQKSRFNINLFSGKLNIL